MTSIPTKTSDPEISQTLMKVRQEREWSAPVECAGCTSSLIVEYDDLELTRLHSDVSVARFVCSVCHVSNVTSPPSAVIERLESDARAAESSGDDDVQE